MANISIESGGLALKSPIIISSSGLTKSLDKVREYASAGAGAVILKSLFEEQINMDCSYIHSSSDYTESLDYISTYVRSQELYSYIDNLRALKQGTDIPILASINCTKNDSWIEFASNIAMAGADGIEVNFMEVETDIMASPTDVENRYVDIISKLSKTISIPIWVKLSPYHTVLPSLVAKLRSVGAASVTLFNRSYQADINIHKEEVSSADIFTHHGDLSMTLRYTGLISGLVKDISISSSTGIHSGEDVVKAILAGASTTQMCSAIYREGSNVIDQSISFLSSWMDDHGYYSIDEFKGKLSYGNIPSAVAFERMQFMKYFSSKH